MATPCSAKAYGGYRRPPQPVLDITDRDLKSANSCSVSWNAKSCGKRPGLRRHRLKERTGLDGVKGGKVRIKQDPPRSYDHDHRGDVLELGGETRTLDHPAIVTI
jgi:hypothetical protein